MSHPSTAGQSPSARRARASGASSQSAARSALAAERSGAAPDHRKALFRSAFGNRQAVSEHVRDVAEITMTIYAHVSLDEKRKTLGRLGEALQ